MSLALNTQANTICDDDSEGHVKVNIVVEEVVKEYEKCKGKGTVMTKTFLFDDTLKLSERISNWTKLFDKPKDTLATAKKVRPLRKRKYDFVGKVVKDIEGLVLSDGSERDIEVKKENVFVGKLVKDIEGQGLPDDSEGDDSKVNQENNFAGEVVKEVEGQEFPGNVGSVDQPNLKDTEEGESLRICPYCLKLFTTPGCLIQHLDEFHYKDDPIMTDTSSILCKAKATTKETVFIDVPRRNGRMLSKCPKCGMTYRTGRHNRFHAIDEKECNCIICSHICVRK